ncbi:type II secretion system F family protein [Mycobacterium sp. 1245499.0]|uniref:type II secretion system F family protein n=1 Tax=Mycobacterium sp. 1245499.0 TaxID=1834074 RepID=UPI000A497B67|nr:type II secretion system F family protein [Mycobacterium sp. 1245499.0]
MNLAAVLLAAALWIGPGPTLVRGRAGVPLRGGRLRRSTGSPRGPDPLAVASCLDVLAVCLAAGMAVSSAAAAAAPSAPPNLARVLRRAAALLALGADPAVAWSVPSGAQDATDPQIDALLRLARRSASSGAALAGGVAELAEDSRHDAAHAASAAAERAGVLIAGPLGLCFLPAFVCLGIVPVVAGLAGQVLQSGLL